MMFSATTAAVSMSGSASSSGGLPAIAAPVSKISEIFRHAMDTIRKEMDGIEQIRSLARKEKDEIQLEMQKMGKSDQSQKRVQDLDAQLQPLNQKYEQAFKTFEAYEAGRKVVMSGQGMITPGQMEDCQKLLGSNYQEWREKFETLEQNKKEDCILYGPKGYQTQSSMTNEYRDAIQTRAILLETRKQMEIIADKEEFQDLHDVLEASEQRLQTDLDDFGKLFETSKGEGDRKFFGSSATSENEDLSKYHAGMKHKSEMSASATGASEPACKKQKNSNSSASASGISATAEKVVEGPNFPKDFPEHSLLKFLQTNPSLSVSEFEKFLATKSETERKAELARSHRGWTVEMVLVWNCFNVFEHYVTKYQIKFSSDRNLPMTDCGFNLIQLMTLQMGFKSKSVEELTRLIQGLLVDPERDYCLLNQAQNGPFTPAAIHIAIRFDQVNFIQALINAGAYPLNLDDVGRTPLHAAVEYQFCFNSVIPKIKVLLQNYYIFTYAQTMKDCHYYTPIKIKEGQRDVIGSLVCELLKSSTVCDKVDERFYKESDVMILAAPYQQ